MKQFKKKFDETGEAGAITLKPCVSADAVIFTILHLERKLETHIRIMLIFPSQHHQ